MATRKATRAIRTPLCNKMIACDGVNLIGTRIEKGYCGKCEAAIIKKAKTTPLKGEPK